MSSSMFGGSFFKSGTGAKEYVDNAVKAYYNAKPVFTPIKQIQATKAQTPHEGLLNHIGHALQIAASFGKNEIPKIPGQVVKADKAIIRPVVDLATHQGGKAAHDTAQLSQNVTGGSVNQVARAAYYTPKAISKEVQNKPITAVQKQAFGTSNSGKIAEKIVGSTAGTASLFTGVGAAKDAAAQGAKDVVEAAAAKTVPKVANAAKDIAEVGASGAVGNAATAEQDNKSLKQTALSAAEGFGAGALLGGASRLVGGIAGKIASKATGKIAAEAPEAGGGAAPKGIVESLPTVAKGDKTRQAVVNREAAIANTQDQFHEAEANALHSKLDTHDQQLMNKLESPKQMSDKAADSRMVRIAQANAHDPSTFIKYARTVRGDLDTVLANRQALHPETQKLSNYFPHFFDRNDAKTQKVLSTLEQRAKITSSKNPRYTFHRIIPTYSQAENLGLKRANPTAHADYLQAIHQNAQENGTAALVRGLKEAHGEGAVSNKVGFDAQSGQHFDALQIPGGRGLTVPQKLADFYNSRAPTKLATTAKTDRTAIQSARAGYKTVNRGGKNVILAGGLFHGLRTAITTAGQQALNLKYNVSHPFSALADNIKLIGGTLSSKAHDARFKQLANDADNNIDKRSSVERMRVGGLSFTSKSIQADLASKRAESGINRLPILKQVHRAVFSRLIPGAKAMIYHQATRKLDSRVPADLAKMRKIAAGINDGLGGIPNAVQGLTPKAASALDNFILGRDLNEGIVSTLGKSVKLNRTDGKLARQFVVGSAAVSALPGLVALAATGKLNTKDPKAVGQAIIAQLENPQIPTPWRNAPTQTNPKGTPISLKLPTTFVSLLTKIIQPVVDPLSTYSGDKLSGLEDAASGRLAFIPSTIEKLATNKDFYGQPIKGGGAANTAKNVINQVIPIPASQISRAASGKENFAEAGLNELGLRGSTSTLPSSDLVHSQAINAFYNTKSSISKLRSQTTSQMNKLITDGKTQQAYRLASQFNANLNKLVTPFRTKYAAVYNPAWDDKEQGFASLLIPTSAQSAKYRTESQVEKQKILSPTY